MLLLFLLRRCYGNGNSSFGREKGVINQEIERWSLGALLIPLSATFFYYIFLFPSDRLLHVFLPLVLSSFALAAWLIQNSDRSEKLYLCRKGWREAISKGMAFGIVLGFSNLLVITRISPWLGYSNEFLRETPHAGFPLWAMFPFGILAVSFIVELLFRGWILGRLLRLFRAKRGGASWAMLLSALYFSFDPFMVLYFKGYHWLALTDGIIWAGLLLKTENLFSTISAHTVEVWIVYLVLKVFYA